ncbi:hypothetical protein DEU56DRAFT_270264, partial [Suillus clintonianus]|uniref:uncharacterized protein n=1 Tax=Suillus clintonianus TaxID=1904413 RepID=UPI001B874257
MPQTENYKSLLRNSIHFPTFSDLPDENEVPSTYYEEGPPSTFSPIQHWCFLGEIVASIGLTRVLLRVKDKDGQVITIGLHTDDRGRPLVPQIKEGHTVAVLYGQQHGFLDMSVGIRVEEDGLLKIIPCSLDQLLKASDVVALRKDQSGCCGYCGKEENTSDSTPLLLCSRCKQASYCGEVSVDDVFSNSRCVSDSS